MTFQATAIGRLVDLSAVNPHALNSNDCQPGRYQKGLSHELLGIDPTTPTGGDAMDIDAPVTRKGKATKVKVRKVKRNNKETLHIQDANLMPVTLTLRHVDPNVPNTEPETLHQMWRGAIQLYEPIETSYDTYRQSLDEPDEKHELRGLDQLFGAQHNPLLPPIELARAIQSSTKGVGMSYLVWVSICFYLSINRRWLRYNPALERQAYNESYAPFLFLLYCQRDFKLGREEHMEAELVSKINDDTDMVACARTHTLSEFVFFVCALVHTKLRMNPTNPRTLCGVIANMLKKNFALFLCCHHFVLFPFANLKEVHTTWVGIKENIEHKDAHHIYQDGIKQRYPQSNFNCETYTPSARFSCYLIPTAYGHLRLSPYQSILSLDRPYTTSGRHKDDLMQLVPHVPWLLWHLLFMIPASERDKQYTGINKFIDSLYDQAIRTTGPLSSSSPPQSSAKKAAKPRAKRISPTNRSNVKRSDKISAIADYHQLNTSQLKALCRMSQLSRDRHFRNLDLACEHQIDRIRLRYCYCERDGVLYWMPPWHLVNRQCKPIDEGSVMHLTQIKLAASLSSIKRISSCIVVQPDWPVVSSQWNVAQCWNAITWPERLRAAFRCLILMKPPPALLNVLPRANVLSEDCVVVFPHHPPTQQPSLANRFQCYLLRRWFIDMTPTSDGSGRPHRTPYFGYMALSCIFVDESYVLSALIETLSFSSMSEFLEALQADHDNWYRRMKRLYDICCESFGDHFRSTCAIITREWNKCSTLNITESQLYKPDLVRLALANQPFVRTVGDSGANLSDAAIDIITSILCQTATVDNDQQRHVLDAQYIHVSTHQPMSFDEMVNQLQYQLDVNFFWPTIQYLCYVECPALRIMLPGGHPWDRPTSSHVVTPLQRRLAEVRLSIQKTLATPSARQDIIQSEDDTVSHLSNSDVQLLGIFHELTDTTNNTSPQTHDVHKKLGHLYQTAMQTNRQTLPINQRFQCSPTMLEAYRILHTTLSSVGIIYPAALLSIYHVLMNEGPAVPNYKQDLVAQLFQMVIQQDPVHLSRLRSSFSHYGNDPLFSCIIKSQAHTEVMRSIMRPITSLPPATTSDQQSSSIGLAALVSKCTNAQPLQVVSGLLSS